MITGLFSSSRNSNGSASSSTSAPSRDLFASKQQGSTLSLESSDPRHSVLSNLAPLQGDEPKAVATQSPLIVRGLFAIATKLCDCVVQLDDDRTVCDAQGRLNIYFGSDVEGTNFKDLVAPTDWGRVEMTLATVTLNCPRLLSVVMVRDNGVGFMLAKLLIMATSVDDPRFIIGVRVDNREGLTEAGENNILDFKPRYSQMSGACSSINFASEAEDQRGGGNMPRSPRFSAQSQATSNYLHSEGSLAFSSASLAYSDTSASFTSVKFWSMLTGGVPQRKVSPSPSVRSAPSFSERRRANGPLGSVLSRSGSGLFNRGPVTERHDADVQTDDAFPYAERVDVETQTDAAHAPGSTTSARPPVAPGSCLVASMGVPGARGSHSSAGSRLSRSSSGDAALGVSSRRSSRSSSKKSSGEMSDDLTLQHFQATPVQTMAYGIDLLTEHCNAHSSNFCCSWHATVHALSQAQRLLRHKGCKKPGEWLPSSGWQCVECMALNDVDEDECAICFGDRTNPQSAPTLSTSPGSGRPSTGTQTGSGSSKTPRSSAQPSSAGFQSDETLVALPGQLEFPAAER